MEVNGLGLVESDLLGPSTAHSPPALLEPKTAGSPLDSAALHAVVTPAFWRGHIRSRSCVPFPGLTIRKDGIPSNRDSGGRCI